MKVIFLDIDGVLNNESYLRTRRRLPGGSSIDARAANNIDPENMLQLNNIVSVTGAKIVVSSSWRSSYDPSHVVRVLAMAGFQGEVIGQTLDRMERGDIIWIAPSRDGEILQWLGEHEHEISHWIAIDDDKLGLQFFWQTSFEHGLTAADAKMICAALCPDRPQLRSDQEKHLNELHKCKTPYCDRLTTAIYCCAPCSLADEGKYEIHETGPLAHSDGCNERYAARQGQQI